MENDKYIVYIKDKGRFQYVYAEHVLKTFYHFTENIHQATHFGYNECQKIKTMDSRVQFMRYTQEIYGIGEKVEVTETCHDTKKRQLSGQSAEILAIRPGSYRLRFDDGFETWMPMEDCS